MTTTEIKPNVVTLLRVDHDELVAANEGLAGVIVELEEELKRTRQRSYARRREVRRLNAQVRTQKLEIESLRGQIDTLIDTREYDLVIAASKIRQRLGDTTAEDRAAERAAFQRKATNRRQAIKGLQRANESLTATLARRPAVQLREVPRPI